MKEYINFIQKSESTPPKTVIVHISGMETFICSLNPAASLYEDVADENEVSKCFLELKEYLKDKNIDLITVKDALTLNNNVDGLMALAIKALDYKRKDREKKFEELVIKSRKDSFEEYLKYSSDEYKKSVLKKFSKEHLIDVILTRPTIELRHIEKDNHIEPTLISFDPLGNLVFCRDQQITTRKGVVIGRTRTSQRKYEHQIMKQVFENLNVKIIGEIPDEKDCYLEGGDYFVAREDLSMLGVGLRTSILGASYLMENDLLGTRYMAICYDEYDQDQQRMHLDTYFNILNDNYVVVIDFDEVAKKINRKVDRRVFYYDNDANAEVIESNRNEIKNKIGNYKLIKIYDDFYKFLDDMKFNYIKISHDEQVNYMINFLNIGNNTILSVNKDAEIKFKDYGITVKYFNFRPILNMYGGMHCMTQVARV